MNRVLLRILKYLAGFALAVALLWWSVHNLTSKDMTEIRSALGRARFWLILPVFGLLLMAHWLRALRWRQLIDPLGYRPSSFLLLCGILVGYIGNQLIPRAGEILRCTTVARVDRIPAEKLIGTIVAERAFDFLTLMFITVCTVVIEYSHVEGYVTEILDKMGHIFSHGGTGRLIAGGLLVVVILALIWIFKKLKNSKPVKFINRIIRGLAEGLTSIRRVESKTLFFIYTFFIWVCYAGATWLGCFALAETSGLNPLTALVMLIFGTFGIIIAPGGLGAYPIAIQKTLIFYGIDANIGLAAGWILWIAQFLFTVVFGTAGWLCINALHSRAQANQNVQTPV